MIYLLTQMILCLALAAVAGGALGWLLHRARAGREDEALRETIVRQHHQLRHAETDVAMLTDDFDDLKQRSQTEIETLRRDNRRLPTLLQNLDKSQALVRQLMQKHEAQLREAAQQNEVLRERLAGHDEREAAFARARSELEGARAELQALRTARVDAPDRADRADRTEPAGSTDDDATGAEVASRIAAASAPAADAPARARAVAVASYPSPGSGVDVDPGPEAGPARAPSPSPADADEAGSMSLREADAVGRSEAGDASDDGPAHEPALDPALDPVLSPASDSTRDPIDAGATDPVRSRAAHDRRPDAHAAMPVPGSPDGTPPDAGRPDPDDELPDDPEPARRFGDRHVLDDAVLDDRVVEFDIDELDIDGFDDEDEDVLDESVEMLFEPVDRHDDLQRIFGIGPVTEQALNRLGITSYSQLAELQRHEIEQIADALQIYPGRIERDDWVGNARRQLEDVLEEL